MVELDSGLGVGASVDSVDSISEEADVRSPVTCCLSLDKAILDGKESSMTLGVSSEVKSGKHWPNYLSVTVS